MSDPIWLAVITALTTMFTATLAFLTVRLGRVAGVTTATAGAVEEVHTLVNSRLTTVLDRVNQLETLLTNRGMALPDAPPHQERHST